jgi:probable rRNA maturation factor
VARVEVVRRARSPEVPDADLSALGRDIARGEGRSFGVVFTFVSDREMKSLHRRHLGDPETTDVLAFDLAEPGADPEGEVILNVALARREGKARGHGTRAEALFYAAHGLLHLLGYDDRTKQERSAMHVLQSRYLAGLGVVVLP